MPDPIHRLLAYPVSVVLLALTGATSPVPAPITLLVPAPAPAPAQDEKPSDQEEPTTRPIRTSVTFAGTTISLPTPLIIVRVSTLKPGSVDPDRAPPAPVEVRLTTPDGVETRTFEKLTVPRDIVRGEDKWTKLIVNGRNTPADGRTTAIEFPKSTAADSQGILSLYVSTPDVSVSWNESPERSRVRRTISGLTAETPNLNTVVATLLTGVGADALAAAKAELLKLSDLELARAAATATPPAPGQTPADPLRAALLLHAAHNGIAPIGSKPEGTTLHQLLLEGRPVLVAVPATTPNSRRLSAAVTTFDDNGAAQATFTLAFIPGRAKPETLLPQVVRVLSGK